MLKKKTIKEINEAVAKSGGRLKVNYKKNFARFIHVPNREL